MAAVICESQCICTGTDVGEGRGRVIRGIDADEAVADGALLLAHAGVKARSLSIEHCIAKRTVDGNVGASKELVAEVEPVATLKRGTGRDLGAGEVLNSRCTQRSEGAIAKRYHGHGCSDLVQLNCANTRLPGYFIDNQCAVARQHVAKVTCGIDRAPGMIRIDAFDAKHRRQQATFDIDEVPAAREHWIAHINQG